MNASTFAPDEAFDLFAAPPKPDPGKHVLMPNMVYACGENILSVAGGFVMGVYQDSEWAQVTCPECRGKGRSEIRRAQERQQGGPR